MGVNNCCCRSKEDRFDQNPRTYKIDNPQLSLKSNVIRENHDILNSEEEEWGVINKKDSSKSSFIKVNISLNKGNEEKSTQISEWKLFPKNLY